MPKVKANGIEIYYEIQGRGEPFVYINGFGANTETMAGRIAPFAKHYRTIIYDTRGVGRSDAPDIPYTPTMMADDLAGLLDTLGIKAAHICGESFGGMIAQHFVLNHPEKTVSLILRCTTCSGPNSPPRDPEYIKFITDTNNAKLPEEELHRLMMPFNVSPAYLHTHPNAYEEFYGSRVVVRYPTSVIGTQRLRGSTFLHDTYDRLPEIKTPTLVVQGDSDRMISPENAPLLASRIPGAELAIIKDAGHFLFEAPEEFVKIALAFLKKHPGAKAS